MFRGSITRPARSLCTLRSVDCSTTTQHTVPAGGQPWPGGIGYPQGPAERFPSDVLHPSSSFPRLRLAQANQRPWAYARVGLRSARAPCSTRGHRSFLAARHAPLVHLRPARRWRRGPRVVPAGRDLQRHSVAPGPLSRTQAVKTEAPDRWRQRVLSRPKPSSPFAVAYVPPFRLPASSRERIG